MSPKSIQYKRYKNESEKSFITLSSRDCNMLWIDVCVTCCLTFTRWSPDSQCDNIRSWGLWEVIQFRWGHQGGLFSMGLVSLQEEISGLSPFFNCSLFHCFPPYPPCEIKQQGNHLQVETQSCWYPNLWLQDCEKYINVCCLSHQSVIFW